MRKLTLQLLHFFGSLVQLVYFRRFPIAGGIVVKIPCSLPRCESPYRSFWNQVLGIFVPEHLLIRSETESDDGRSGSDRDTGRPSHDDQGIVVDDIYAVMIFLVPVDGVRRELLCLFRLAIVHVEFGANISPVYRYGLDIHDVVQAEIFVRVRRSLHYRSGIEFLPYRVDADLGVRIRDLGRFVEQPDFGLVRADPIGIFPGKNRRNAHEHKTEQRDGKFIHLDEVIKYCGSMSPRTAIVSDCGR